MFNSIGSRNSNIFGKKEESKSALEDSNPFKMNIAEIGKMTKRDSNPFQMKLGAASQTASLFFAPQDDDNFDQVLREAGGKTGSSVKELRETKLSKNQSKESNNYEQNIRRYKDILRGFYNSNYPTKIYEQASKRAKKLQNMPSNGNSQQIRKPEACFKANRLPFNKENKQKMVPYQKLEEYYLISYIKQSRSLVIYELKHQNIKQLKPMIIKITSEDNQFSPNIEYDSSSGRAFLFSNKTQQIIVISTKVKQLICKINVKHERTNPSLYIYKSNHQIYLFLIGGYRLLANGMVEGSNHVEVYNIDKWEISLKPVVLKMGIGRISPIVFASDQANQQSIYIIGGSTLASLHSRKGLQFDIDQDINISTNKTAIKIEISFIEQSFANDYQSNSLLANSINVQFSSPLLLYGGVVLFRKLLKSQKLQLFLPKRKQIYEIRTLKNDVHITESELISEGLLWKDGDCMHSIGYHRAENNISELYRLNDGKLDLVNVRIRQRKSSKKSQQECTLI